MNTYMRNRGFSPIFIIILIVVLAVGVYMVGTKGGLFKISLIPQEKSASNISVLPISDSKIYFLNELNSVSFYDFDSKSVEKVIDAETFAVSKDGEWLAYTSGYETAKEMTIFIQNLKSGKTTSFNSQTSLIRRLGWSENAKYLVTDSGTGPEGSMAIFDKSGNKIATINTGSLVWAENDSLLFYSTKMEVNPSRPWGSGYGSGVGSIILSSGERTDIISPDATTDYFPMSLEDGKVIINKRQVPTSNDWLSDEKIVDLYQALNPQDLSSVKISEPELVYKENDVKQMLLAADILSLKTLNDYEWGIFFNDKVSDWVLLQVNTEGKIDSNEIYLVNLSDIKSSHTLLYKGGYPSWR